ncbi:glutamine--fructose-6-phosphate transaminase (isomerizing) [Solemya elarraichensis gill symbiont]|uniref:Glutamine--fructose-6-phosphate aminotransferase [isomerizing] n=1 Tax=Solemya elarraichensis gill symbiont TaxID=1918949 RepID=A0A1T2L2E0_9GAMM|nr:glutamine--fructose-6-phosphate transaminase (isomerizing) [Solemya elarraichensis gill symbiont]OOZ39267.1 glutamine--fructose-6-phosphate aminotransferase [Solemya elarraichensis gill symbiont]
MCGIVGGVAQRPIAPILIEGLKRLEYRGYDSAGVALVENGKLWRERTKGKVAQLETRVNDASPQGNTGIGHTRWATHGEPTVSNAHPHSCKESVALVHNGIIENHAGLREQQSSDGHLFTSDTDTEVIVHAVYDELQSGISLLQSVQNTVKKLEGAYALGVMYRGEEDVIVAARRGSPLVVGIGIGENFIASDISALLPVTRRFIILEDGDTAQITASEVAIYDQQGQLVERPIKESNISADAVERGEYRHYMLKEIYEQPHAIAETLEGRLSDTHVLEAAFGPKASELFDGIKSVRIIACGTSFHAGMVARNWFEGLAGIPCQVEVASEFRYRHPVADPATLVIAISQSGETADTLSALRAAQERGFGPTLGICNVPESSLIRETDLNLMTRAGPEIGVASTKAFTTQLVALLLLVTVLGRRFNITREREAIIVKQLAALPRHLEDALQLDDAICQMAEHFSDKSNALFLGRGVQYPVAKEGALKLKEISYIHAEAYPAGELKHGPLALVDEEMPIVAVAPNDDLLGKLKSNLEEVRARIIFTIPLQLLAYHVAVLKGTDVDQPRNLAKSVTVE